MPSIHFDVLVPDSEATELEGSFAAALDKLVAAGKLSAARVERDDHPALPDGVESELRRVYTGSATDLHVRRYALLVEGVTGSINQLTMVLSRLLTPQAALPKDKVLLERENLYEVPPRYPWTADIIR